VLPSSVSGPEYGVLIGQCGPQESSSVSRPLTQAGVPARQPNQRHHSHSISLGAVNANHRVTRRKSMTSTAAANAAAAVAASLKDSSEANGFPVTSSHRRALSGRKGLESTSMGHISGFSPYLSRSVNAASPDHTAGRKHSPTAVDENHVADSDTSPVSTKDRNRRASEGAPLMRGEGKRVSTEVRCERCGKGYKHSSCLTKHMCVYPLSCPPRHERGSRSPDRCRANYRVPTVVESLNSSVAVS
jgi:hypothetical protein